MPLNESVAAGLHWLAYWFSNEPPEKMPWATDEVFAAAGSDVACRDCGTVLYRMNADGLYGHRVRAKYFDTVDPRMPDVVGTDEASVEIPCCCECGNKHWLSQFHSPGEWA